MRPLGLVLKQLPRDQATVDGIKKQACVRHFDTFEILFENIMENGALGKMEHLLFGANALFSIIFSSLQNFT